MLVDVLLLLQLVDVEAAAELASRCCERESDSDEVFVEPEALEAPTLMLSVWASARLATASPTLTSGSGRLLAVVKSLEMVFDEHKFSFSTGVDDSEVKLEEHDASTPALAVRACFAPESSSSASSSFGRLGAKNPRLSKLWLAFAARSSPALFSPCDS